MARKKADKAADTAATKATGEDAKSVTPSPTKHGTEVHRHETMKGHHGTRVGRGLQEEPPQPE